MSNLKRILSGKPQQLEPQERTEQQEDVLIMSEQARQILQSKLGKYLIARMERDQKAAMLALTKVDHWDTAQIRSLQEQYDFACRIQNYFADIINEGSKANYELNNLQE